MCGWWQCTGGVWRTMSPLIEAGNPIAVLLVQPDHVCDGLELVFAAEAQLAGSL